jgi:beta-lactamase class A
MASALAPISRLARSIPGDVGAAAMIVETGEFVGVHPDARYPMQSVYKFPIAWAVLAQVDSGRLTLNREVDITRKDLVPEVHSPIRDQNPAGVKLTVRELLRAAIVESDGTASDMLVSLVPFGAITGMVHFLGADSMMLVATERQMVSDGKAQYRDWSTPRAAVQLLRAFTLGHGLSAPSRTLLQSWMTTTTIGPHRIPGLLPKGTVVAHKTGTSNTRGNLTAATNDIGVITLPGGRHLAVAVFVRDSRASVADRELVIARIARAAYDAATKR